MDTIDVTAKFSVTIPADKVLVDRDEWEHLTSDGLVGQRWTRQDCIDHLKGGGMRISDFTNHVLKPKRQELESIGAVLSWSNGKRGGGSKYLFRATVMSKWLEDNLDQITRGGWPHDSD
ncbi:DUF771 domain-containing protein [Lacticaseibacillus absianus]|uniref:DUF771 domain-containing protein n=1 Tax=Lacticaseibacillus absianus TaxID=2729623 RepID=UPI0015C75D98|nr:DUF771 domain-containing protein [Lacticaseibacillus absianus]